MALAPLGEFTWAMPRASPRKNRTPVSVEAFYIDVDPVTQELYQKVMGVNPSKQKNPQAPVAGDAVDRRRPLLQ